MHRHPTADRFDSIQSKLYWSLEHLSKAAFEEAWKMHNSLSTTSRGSSFLPGWLSDAFLARILNMENILKDVKE